MVYLDKKMLEAILKTKGLNVSGLARACGVSRQSIYNMCGKSSIFNTSFEKLLDFLGVGFDKITTEQRSAQFAARNFPANIAKIALKLFHFAEKNKADLILFGSRARGVTGIRADWDFALEFHEKNEDTMLRLLRQKLIDEAFPYRVDIINLNLAPDWFKTSIGGEMIYLRKEEKL